MVFPTDRLTGWIVGEPTTALMMLIAAIVLFGTSFVSSKDDSARTFWPWFRRVIEATVTAFLFLGLLWAFRSILNSNRSVFHSTHGSFSETNLNTAYSIWGRPHTQWELSVSHYIDTVVIEEIPREDPSAPPLFREVATRELVEQNSILSVEGEVELTLSEREKGYAYYNGFEADGRFEYEIINDSGLKTEAEFLFPLSPGQTIHENFQVVVDGEDISPLLRLMGDAVTWTEVMEPHERKTIVVTYQSRGMEYFYYQIPTQREIRDFSLTIKVDRLPVSLLNYPAGCLTPHEVRPTDDGQGSILTWTFDRAVTTAGMGVALPQPEQPGANVLRALQNSPYALTLLIATISLTLLILGEEVSFLDLALLSGVYCLQFLLMAAVSDYFLGFWGSLALGATLTSLLAFLLFRRHESRLLRILVAALVLFFTVAYPLSGLFTEMKHRHSFDGMVQVSLIVYLFGLSLYSRLRVRRPEEEVVTSAVEP